MTTRTGRRVRRSTVAGIVGGALLLVLGPVPLAETAAAAGARQVNREGNCRIGAGDWEMQVRRRARLRVEFRVDDVVRRRTWKVFVSDNGRRVAALRRRSNGSGEFEVRLRTRNRRGVDRVWVSAVNPRTGNSCTGHVRI